MESPDQIHSGPFCGTVVFGDKKTNPALAPPHSALACWTLIHTRLQFWVRKKENNRRTTR